MQVDGVVLQVQVLNECFWPLSASDKLPVANLPDEIAKCVQRFDTFYRQDTSNRKLKALSSIYSLLCLYLILSLSSLFVHSDEVGSRAVQWIFNHGSVQLNANYGKGKLLQFVMTPLQASVLLLFNNTDTMTFQEILQVRRGKKTERERELYFHSAFYACLFN